MKKGLISIIFLFIATSPINSLAKFREIDYDKCLVPKKSFEQVIKQVKKKDHDVIGSLSGCLKYSHKLIFQACLIDPSQLKNSQDLFKDNENFVLRLMKIHPEILQYASNRLRGDKLFIKRATYIERDALKYASKKLRDNKFFMQEMITRDSRNYIFASTRIQSSPKLAELAFKDNGALLIHAPSDIKSNKKLVKIALKSSFEGYDFIDPKLKKDPEILKIISHKKTAFSKQKLEKFIKKNYLKKHGKKNTGKIINETSHIFKNNILIDRKYITKWQRSLYLKGFRLREEWNLTAAHNRNFPNSWQQDLANYPDLVKKIENFFKRRYIDKNTIDSLLLTYLWRVKNDPKTLAFNLYLIRPSNDIELGQNYIRITSLSAIAKKSKNGWRLSVVNVIFDRETKANIAYNHGHKKYILQDLYLENDKDKNPKIIFKIEDKFNDYFEIFGEMSGDKYKLLYRFDPLKIKEEEYDNDNLYNTKRTREEQEEYEWQKMIKN